MHDTAPGNTGATLDRRPDRGRGGWRPRVVTAVVAVFLAACLLWASLRAQPTENWTDIVACAAEGPEGFRGLCSPDVHFTYGWPVVAFVAGQTYLDNPESRWHRWVLGGVVVDGLVALAVLVLAVVLCESTARRVKKTDSKDQPGRDGHTC
jgi:biotin transporter BioY